MENKKKSLVVAASLVGVALSVAVAFGGAGPLIAAGESGTDYSISFDVNTNKIGTEAYSASSVHSGKGFAATGLGNQIGFEYNSFYNPTTVWQIIKGGGYFTNTDPIHGMKSITIAKNSTAANLKVYWSETTSFDETKSSTYDSTSAQTFTCDFGGYTPNYLKVVALGTSNSSIKTASILFSCANLYATLAVTADHPEMGAVSGGGIHKIGSDVALTATPNAGYKFSGWYHDETLLSSDASYSFTMPQCVDSYAVEARFLQKAYTLTLASESESKGTASGAVYFEEGESLTITATPKDGYSFAGWYSESNLVSTENPYVFLAPANDLSYIAKFSANENVLSLSSAEVVGTATPAGSCDVGGSGTYAYGSSVTITATPASGYGFLGWYEGSSLVSSENPYSFSMPNKALSYVAKYAKKYHVSAVSSDASKGTVAGTGDYPYSLEVTLTGNPVSPQNTVTWHDSDLNVVSNSNSYTFAMPENDISYSADFSQVLKDSFYLGKYPQTVVEDSAMLTALASATDSDSDGYLEYGSDEYKKATGAPYQTSYKSASGSTTFARGTAYYFKVEPIVWRVLSGKGTATGLVMSEKVLTKGCYYPNYNTNRTISGSTVFPNNYRYSTLRAMLNGYDGSSYSVDNFTGKGFLDVAFMETEKAYIATTTVDNSAATTGSSPNLYDCESTSDRIFALSYQDLVNTSYGFSTSASRCGVLTDYARATGVWMPTYSPYYGNGCWWSRSPNADDSGNAGYVDGGGALHYDCSISYAGNGVRPSFTVRIG